MQKVYFSKIAALSHLTVTFAEKPQLNKQNSCYIRNRALNANFEWTVEC